MKVSELWLREWVNPSLNGQQLAVLLTMAGLEVDAVTPVAGAFERVIVAEVVNTLPHPQADRLTLCEVNIGSEIEQELCALKLELERSDLLITLCKRKDITELYSSSKICFLDSSSQEILESSVNFLLGLADMLRVIVDALVDFGNQLIVRAQN